MTSERRRQIKSVLCDQQGGLCGICGNAFSAVEYAFAELDHILPVSAGGGDEVSNLRLTHQQCNRRRGASLA